MTLSPGRRRRLLTLLAAGLTVALVPVGCATIGGTGEHVAGTPWHHLADGFRNPPGSPRRTATTGDMLAFFWRRATASEDIVVPAGHVAPPAEAADGLASFAGQDHITWIGHATFLIRTGGQTILTDPFMTDRASPFDSIGPKRFVPPGIAIKDLPPIDIIVVSHNHYDHLDARTIAALPNKRDIDVVVPLGVGDIFRDEGYTRIHEVDWYQGVTVGAVTVTGLPAIHFSRRGLFDTNRALWMSAAIRSPTQHIFFSGDTGYGPVFKEIGKRAGPFDIALVAIGAYEPAKIMHAVHVTPEEAVRLGRDIGARRIVGMHWGTIAMTEEPPFEPPMRFRKAGHAGGYDAAALWLMQIGETRPLPPGSPREQTASLPAFRRPGP